MMNPELKKKWVAALRSGKYKQAKKRLHNKKTGGFCCIGVLCEVAKPAGWDGVQIEWEDEGENYAEYHELPDFLREDFGLPNSEHTNLIEMNDGGKRFKTIAKYIEKNL